ncbi:MAG: bifunctional UDP-N-acetylglucosamine diphosphorylase/glucosamine-1-phosphate N-acetyltransferase GlmU [Pseudomonadota bacterium]
MTSSSPPRGAPHRTAVVVLAAGKGTRMKSRTPKVLHEIAGRSMLGHVLDAAARLNPERTVLVVGTQAERVAQAARALNPDIVVAEQDPPRGTGDAVRRAAPALAGFSGAVLVLYADTPLVRAETMARLAARTDDAAAAVLGFRPGDPGAYGRLKQDADGALAAIVEAADAGPNELAIGLCNSGVMAFDAEFLASGLPRLSDDNAKGEFYLTDLVAIARSDGRACAVEEAPSAEVVGVNSRAELADAERAFQNARRRTAMADGVTLIDPDTVYFSYDTDIAADVVVEPGVVFGPGVVVERDARIKAYSHLEGARVHEGAQIGPFARLRPGADVGAAAKVGNFVEVKQAALGAGAKVSHLTYIGDAHVGARANVGAGTITCNYDGRAKHRTEIGADAFVGSNASLVAPVTLGAGAYVGSGSVVTRDVPAGALAVARGRQRVIEGWAARFQKKGRRDE